MLHTCISCIHICIYHWNLYVLFLQHFENVAHDFEVRKGDNVTPVICNICTRLKHVKWAWTYCAARSATYHVDAGRRPLRPVSSTCGGHSFFCTSIHEQLGVLHSYTKQIQRGYLSAWRGDASWISIFIPLATAWAIEYCDCFHGKSTVVMMTRHDYSVRQHRLVVNIFKY